MPALTPSPNVGSQLERAVIAWLYEALGGQTPMAKFYFSNDYKDRQPPFYDVFASRSRELVKHSRVEACELTIEYEYPAKNQPGVTNKDANWCALNTGIGLAQAAMSLEYEDEEGFRLSAFKIAQAGRRLAVLGTPKVTDATPTDIANNADMATFYCNYLEFKGSVRGEAKGAELFWCEKRVFEIHACNLEDDSIFPKLCFDGIGTLNWTFTGDMPDFWLLEKSVDGVTWTTQEVLNANTMTAEISGTGQQYWRVRTSVDGATGDDPESNILKITAN